jgi:membrane-associated protease RseP (regulator of RpoE activity)
MARPEVEPQERGERRLRTHVLLFLATCGTTFLSGAGFGSGFSAQSGLYFAGTLMAILICHEMGHYIAARLHGIPVSLPYFIPMPPMVTFGTMGAVIRMDDIDDRNRLADVGAAGPLAGLLVALPLLYIGLTLSQLGPVTTEGAVEGNSLAYAGLKYLVYESWLPSRGVDVQLHPMAFAAWVGVLITMINLIPVGQLDGGHIACAALGEQHEAFSRAIHLVLPAMAVAVTSWMLLAASAVGVSIADALWPAVQAGLPWAVWAALLIWLKRMAGGRYHPPVGTAQLSPARRILVALMFVLLIAIFTPVPLRSGVLP